jgi:hypothetical protein
MKKPGIPGINATILNTLILDGELDCLLSSSTRGVSHCSLAIYIKK